MDVSECSLADVPKGLPSSTRYAQMRRNNISSLSLTAFVECPFASIVVLDDNRIDDVDQQASVVGPLMHSRHIYQCLNYWSKHFVTYLCQIFRKIQSNKPVISSSC